VTTYTNPVYPHYFADPFVLRHEGSYYAYGTGAGGDADHAFEVLRSPDLLRWESLGGVLATPGRAPGAAYWAPEVAWDGARFYLYYSVGVGDKGHRLRVAAARAPAGPFEDIAALETGGPFAIDPHPFCDADGQWYLFYATDFLEGERVGTALAVDRLLDMTRLAGEPRTVLRASHDWQLFERRRAMYGGVYDWHTLEGPFVVARGGRYVLFFSGGRWENETYGVSYAVAPHPLGPWLEPEPGAPAVLRTVPGRVLGPGHNSVVRTPAGQDYLVYHAWDAARTARRMFVDRLRWTPQGPRSDGPTLTPQPAPEKP
jgi:beta-xylosidase